MEWSKLKNIIILVLLIVNICLLLLAGGRQRQAQAAEDELKRSTIEFMKKKGIQLSEEVVPWEERNLTLTTERNQEAEARLATAILGDSKKSTVGIAMEYSGEGGTVRFYPDGRFSVLFSEGQGYADADTQSDMERHALTYMEALGMQVTLLGSSTEQEKTSLHLLQMTQGHPVFTCEIEMRYRDGQLQSIEGWRLFGAVKEDKVLQEPLTASTLLLRLVEAIQVEKITYTEIRGITQGYSHSTTSLALQSTLHPVWRVETDTYILLLNCMTGKLESALPVLES